MPWEWDLRLSSDLQPQGLAYGTRTHNFTCKCMNTIIHEQKIGNHTLKLYCSPFLVTFLHPWQLASGGPSRRLHTGLWLLSFTKDSPFRRFETVDKGLRADKPKLDWTSCWNQWTQQEKGNQACPVTACYLCRFNVPAACVSFSPFNKPGLPGKAHMPMYRTETWELSCSIICSRSQLFCVWRFIRSGDDRRHQG